MTNRLPDGSPRRVVIYCRISDDREGKRWGVDRQEKACRDRAARNGWEVVEVLVENDISAYSGKLRPKYQRLLAMLASGEANAVLALSGKRLQRDYRAAFAFLDLAEEHDIAVDTIKAGAYNLNTAEGRSQARHAAVDAQGESEEISERVRDAKQDNLRDGTFRGGPRPFGYEADGVTPRSLLCPECLATDGFNSDRECGRCGASAVNAEGSEAWRTEQATDAVIAGESLRSLERAFAAAGVRTVARRYKQPDGSRGEPEDRAWEAEQIRALLLRPRNAGLMDHHGEIVGRASWPAIVPEEKWRACKAVLDNPGRRTTTGNERVWLGSGLYLCGYDGCTESVRCSTSGRGAGKGHVIAYRCRTGKHVTRAAELLDEHVERVAVERLKRPGAAELLLPPPSAGPDRSALAADANALRAKLDGFAADFAADLITRQQMLDGTALTRKRLEHLEASMANLARASVLAALPLGTDAVEEAWPTYSLSKRRAIVDALMTVTLLPARRGRPKGYVPAKPGERAPYFDPAYVRIEWKHEG